MVFMSGSQSKIVLVLFALFISACVSEFNIVGYLPEYRSGGIKDWDLICKHSTHIIFFSVEPSKDGTIGGLDRLPSVDVLTSAREAAQNHGTKLLLGIGGAGRSSGFAAMVKNSETKLKFISAVIKLCMDKQLDGIDIDWEVPTTVDELKLMVELWATFKQNMDKYGFILTTALHPTQEAFLNHELLNFVDMVHMMVYDQRGKHSTLEYAEEVINNIESLGLPLSKFTLGVPFYGRNVFNGEPVPYYDIVKKGSWREQSDEADNIFYNGKNLISKKVKLAMKKGLAGIMIWELGQDVQVEDKSLLVAAHQATKPNSGKVDL
eukprot:TRINITY_DN12336_c0_g1_i1.p2 TRINITY_DN12336_c0_g1~~TRINITY_DN12336_c0_g1_i1.p2  ORF type:complete len:321 (+),score=59.81 TRINITY_DN12336_c0_g1_i1:1107-2069(+)